MDSKEIAILKKALERQKKARQQAERILEEKSKELYDVTYHLQETNSKLENLLSEKTSELDGVFINIIDPYVVMDLSFNVINMNSSAKEFLGYDHSKENLNLAKIVHEDFIVYTRQSFKSLLEVGTLKNYRAKIIAKNNTEKWVQINSSLIYNTERKPIAAQGIVRDITQEMEIKRQKHRDNVWTQTDGQSCSTASSYSCSTSVAPCSFDGSAFSCSDAVTDPEAHEITIHVTDNGSHNFSLSTLVRSSN